MLVGGAVDIDNPATSCPSSPFESAPPPPPFASLFDSMMRVGVGVGVAVAVLYVGEEVIMILTMHNV